MTTRSRRAEAIPTVQIRGALTSWLIGMSHSSFINAQAMRRSLSESTVGNWSREHRAERAIIGNSIEKEGLRRRRLKGLSTREARAQACKSQGAEKEPEVT